VLHASSPAKHSGKFDSCGQAALDLVHVCLQLAFLQRLVSVYNQTQLPLAVVLCRVTCRPHATTQCHKLNSRIKSLGTHYWTSTPVTATSPGPQATTVTDMLVLSSSFIVITSKVNRYVPGGFCRLMSSNASPVTGSDELRANGRPSRTACAQHSSNNTSTRWVEICSNIGLRAVHEATSTCGAHCLAAFARNTGFCSLRAAHSHQASNIAQHSRFHMTV